MTPVYNVSAQELKETLKDRKALAKATRNELNTRATKTARKESRRLEKEGWVVAPGHMPLEKQLDRSYMMQYEYDESLFPFFDKG